MQDPFWERRTRPGKPGSGSSAGTGGNIVTPSVFKQQLIKCCQRQTKHDRPFCVASIRVLEYDQVATDLGPGVAEQLNRLVQDVCRKVLRDADRITMVEPGRFLCLFPDTDGSGANRALARIAAQVASARMHHKHKPLHASCSVLIADSQQYGSDVDALLDALGYTLDTGGKLHPFDSHAHHIQAQPFSGDFASWAARYNPASWNNAVVRREELEAPGLIVEQLEAVDHWRHRETVLLQTIRREDGGAFGAELMEIINKRARIVQHIDHPCITNITDYHVKDRSILYLVRPKMAVAEPCLFIDDVKPDIATALDWLLQISNALIYMQGLVPPLVPPVLDECLYIEIDKGNPAIIDYELPYLLPDYHIAATVGEHEYLAASQGRPVAAYRPLMDSLTNFMELVSTKCGHGCDRLEELINRLSTTESDAGTAGVPPASDPTRRINTIYKIRAALMEILDAEKTRLVSEAERR